MKQRLPVVMSATALTVALFGSTPLGHAVVSSVPPLAKHARTADFARNAGSVNGLKASKRPRAGWLVALGPGGKFPAGVGVAGPSGPPGPLGPAGPQGPKGDRGNTGGQGPTGASGTTGPRGAPGLSGYTVVQGSVSTSTNAFQSASATCPSGTRPLGGGGGTSTPLARVTVRNSFPTNTGWLVVVDAANFSSPWTYQVDVVCANIAS